MRNAFVGCAAALMVAAVLWPRPVLSHETVNTTVTYDGEIVRILKKKCIACHSESNLGVALTSYEQARPWARAIEEEVLRKRMPPWRAVRGYGQFANDLALTNLEQLFIVAWVEGNGPKTKDQRTIVNVDQGETPATERLNVDFARWQLGTPDLSKSIEPFSVMPGQDNLVRRATIDLGLRSDRWIRSLEFKPGNRRVVRAAFFSLQETGQWLGSWTPWYGVTTLPPQVAYRIPAGSHLVAEIHYQSTDQPVEDKGTLGIYWASEPVAHSPTDLVMEAKPDGVSNAPRQKFSASLKVDADVSILAFKPELLAGLESVEVSVKKPNGTTQVLLFLREIMAQWPTPYILKEPVLLPKNTEIAMTAYYKNSPASRAPASIRLVASAFGGGVSGPAASRKLQGTERLR